MFEKTIKTRVTESQAEQIKYIVQENPQLYESESHFIRCAVIQLLRKKDEVKPK